MPKQKARTKTRSHLFSTIGIVLCSLVIVGLFGVAALIGSGIRSGTGLPAAVISGVLVDLANGDRSSNSLTDLTVNPILTAAAQAKANDMAAKSYFAHTSPDGHDPWYWFQQAGYKFSYAGENLAINFSDSDQVETAWMNSPEHRANILNDHYTEIGIATAKGTYQGHPTVFVVQLFGTPAVTTTPQPTKLATTATTPKPTRATTTTTTTKKTGTSARVVSASQQVASSSAVGTAAPRRVLGETATPPASSLIEHAVASPDTSLHYVYYFLGFLVLVGLLFETRLELRKHHIRHVVAALFLLVLMSGLIVVGDRIIFTTQVLASAGG